VQYCSSFIFVRLLYNCSSTTVVTLFAQKYRHPRRHMPCCRWLQQHHCCCGRHCTIHLYTTVHTERAI